MSGSAWQQHVWTKVHTLYYRPYVKSIATMLSSPQLQRRGQVHDGGIINDGEKKTYLPLPNIVTNSFSRHLVELSSFILARLGASTSRGDNSTSTSGSSSSGGSSYLAGSNASELFGGQNVSSSFVHTIGLLRILAFLSNNSSSYGGPMTNTSLIHRNEFVNMKLTTKVMRQLQDPLTLCSVSPPEWCVLLVQQYHALLPFDARRFYFGATAFGISRALHRFYARQQQEQNAGGGGAGGGGAGGSGGGAGGSGGGGVDGIRIARIKRQKVRVHRNQLLESCMYVMDMTASSKAVLEVEYFNEVGTGIGPTMEFFTLVSREFARKDLHIWLDNDSKGSACNLFFRPYHPSTTATATGQSVIRYCRALGQLIGRSMMDDRVMDLPLATPMYKLILEQPLTDSDIMEIYPAVASTLNKLEYVLAGKATTVEGASIEDLTLDFTFPGLADVELKPGGADVAVTSENLGEYVASVKKMLLVDGISEQVRALRAGMASVFDLTHLRAFDPVEVGWLINGTTEAPFTMDALRENVKCDHGYTHESSAVRMLFELLCELSSEEQKEFIMFVTGAPRLPVGGLSALSPNLTIVRKPASEGSTTDQTLPSVSTCFFFLKLPDYSSKEIMRNKIFTAMKEGQGNFHMS